MGRPARAGEWTLRGTETKLEVAVRACHLSDRLDSRISASDKNFQLVRLGVGLLNPNVARKMAGKSHSSPTFGR